MSHHLESIKSEYLIRHVITLLNVGCVKDPRLNPGTSSNHDYLQKLTANSRHEPLTAIHRFGEPSNDKARAKRLNSTDQAKQLTASSNSPGVQSSSQHTKAMRLLSISESAAAASTAPVKAGNHLASLSKNSHKLATRVKSETDSPDTADNLFVEDSDSSTGSLTSHKRSLKVQPSSSRLSISSIKQECVLSSCEAEKVLPGSVAASPTAAATPQQQGLATATNSAVKSLEERIKMLDEMMDKQQKNKLGGESEKQVSTKLASASASHLASSFATSSTAGKANKLSKLFDLDEQRLQSAAIIHVSMT